MGRHKRNAAALAGACGADAAEETTNTADCTASPREFQGTTGNRRHACQPNPVWTQPKAKNAADALTAALSGWTALIGEAPRVSRGLK